MSAKPDSADDRIPPHRIAIQVTTDSVDLPMAGTMDHGDQDTASLDPRFLDELPPLPRPLPVLPQRIGGTRQRGSASPPWPSIQGFEVLAELGRGGMGVVYRAVQLELGREVALKMLLAGEFAGEQERGRFRREAEALAQLQHPNIVQVYSVGEQDGHSFFSMELIEGPSLDRAIKGRTWPPTAAAVLVEQLARAVQSAHDRGIIHRDLKPGNVLLVGSGEDGAQSSELGVPSSSLRAPSSQLPTPKITDFGLAKRADDSATTRAGAVLGTPSYMAPEQASGANDAIGPATDIYALGAILYELLTGRPPFLAATSAETIRQVLTDEPIAPRKLLKSVPRDLETICLHCLEFDPRKRYASALALADDLRRFREGLPLLAQAHSLWQRTAKWIRRRPTSAALLATSCLALFALLSTWIVFTAQLKVERDDAQEARREESIQRAAAEANFQRARQAVDQFYVSVSQEQLLNTPGMQPLRHKLMESALDYHLAFLKERSNDVSVGRDVAWAYGRIGLIRKELGRIPQAFEAFEKAKTIYEAEWSKDPTDETWGTRLASTYHDIALMQRIQGHLQDAFASYHQSLDIEEQLIDRFGSTNERQREVAKTLSNLGVLGVAMGHTDEGLTYGRRACELLTRIAAETSTADDRLSFARGLINFAEAQSKSPPSAIESLEHARTVLIALTGEDPDSQDLRIQLAKCLYGLGTMQGENGNLAACRDFIQQAILLFRELARENPKVPDLRMQLAVCMFYFSNIQMEDNRLDEARELVESSRHEIEALLAEYPDRPDYWSLCGAILHRCGDVAVRQNRLAEATEDYLAAIGAQEKAVAASPSTKQYMDFLQEHRSALEKHGQAMILPIVLL